ncbi:hypothetical protein EBU02_07360 [bacterium]|nr:hypothetical protein [bacterium]NBS52720.1 hypothetical protein [Spartobacteria bacterium]
MGIYKPDFMIRGIWRENERRSAAGEVPHHLAGVEEVRGDTICCKKKNTFFLGLSKLQILD